MIISKTGMVTMPEKCAECAFPRCYLKENEIDATVCLVSLNSLSLKDQYIKRPADCPLVEIEGLVFPNGTTEYFNGEAFLRGLDELTKEDER